jgi:hypothetical protein
MTIKSYKLTKEEIEEQMFEGLEMHIPFQNGERKHVQIMRRANNPIGRKGFKRIRS